MAISEKYTVVWDIYTKESSDLCLDYNDHVDDSNFYQPNVNELLIAATITSRLDFSYIGYMGLYNAREINGEKVADFMMLTNKKLTVAEQARMAELNNVLLEVFFGVGRIDSKICAAYDKNTKGWYFNVLNSEEPEIIKR